MQCEFAPHGWIDCAVYCYLFPYLTWKMFLCHMPQQKYSWDRFVPCYCFVSPALAGEKKLGSLSPVIVVCCCENRLTFGSNFYMLWWISLPQQGHRCNIGTISCWWAQRSHIKVKTQKVISVQAVSWKCESEKLKSVWNRTWFRQYIISKTLYVHVNKDRMPRSKIIRCRFVRKARNIILTPYEKLKAD